MIPDMPVGGMTMFDPMELLKKFSEPAQFLRNPVALGLTPNEAGSAVEALMPALSAALRRRAADPRGLAEMMGLVKRKPDFSASMPGGEALGRLFGSRELTSAVIDQVAGASGVDRKALEIVLPMATETMMAAFSDSLKSHPLTEGLGTFLAPKPRSAPDLEEILTDTIGPNTARLVGKTLRETPNPMGPTNPLGEILGEFIRGFNNGGPPIDEPVAPEDEVPHPREMVDRLFEAGRDVHGEQARALEAIFDRFWADAGHMAVVGSTAAPDAAAPGVDNG